MNCEQGQILLNARIDGELLPEDRYRLEAHLGTCATCRAASEELEQTDRALARALGGRARVAAAAVADRALQEWLAEAPAPSRPWQHLHWITAAAAGFALAFLVYGPYGANDLTGRSMVAAGELQEQQITALVEAWTHDQAPEDVELQLRSLGNACATPLADALQAWDSQADEQRRIEVASVLCDLADTAQIPTLINLLGDPSPEIQTRCEATLVRLTGRTLASSADASQLGSCSTLQGDWLAWWDENRHRFEPHPVGPVQP